MLPCHIAYVLTVTHVILVYHSGIRHWQYAIALDIDYFCVVARLPVTSLLIQPEQIRARPPVNEVLSRWAFCSSRVFSSFERPWLFDLSPHPDILLIHQYGGAPGWWRRRQRERGAPCGRFWHFCDRRQSSRQARWWRWRLVVGELAVDSNPLRAAQVKVSEHTWPVPEPCGLSPFPSHTEFIIVIVVSRAFRNRVTSSYAFYAQLAAPLLLGAAALANSSRKIKCLKRTINCVIRSMRFSDIIEKLERNRDYI